MRRSQYSEEQIIAIQKEPEAGKPIRELCREHGLTDQTYYPAGAIGSGGLDSWKPRTAGSSIWSRI